MAESDGGGFYVRCVDCGASVEVPSDVFQLLGLCNGWLHARGEDPMRDDEIARCLTCQRRWRDDFDPEVYLAELRATMSDLRKGMAVPQDQMQRVLAGPFGSNMREWLEANRMSSRREEEAPRKRQGKAKWKGRPDTNEEER